MEGYKAGWKVVLPIPPSNRPGWTYTSCAVSDRDYLIGGVTRPRKGAGPLCVFEDADSAVAFMKANAALWEFRGGERVLFPCWYKPSEKDRIWSGWCRNDTHRLEHLPRGTVLAEEIVLCGEPFFKAGAREWHPSTSFNDDMISSSGLVTVGM